MMPMYTHGSDIGYTLKAGGYSLVNISTRYQLNNTVTLLAGVRNLFDRQYELPLGGLNLAAGNVPLLSQGRSIDLGLNLKF